MNIRRTAVTIAGTTILSGLLVLGCASTQQSTAPPNTRAADEEAIRKADADWSAAAQAKQVDGWLGFYSDDAVMLPPDGKMTEGKESLRKGVTDLLALPGLSLHWQASKVVAAASGELGYVYGTYEDTMNGPKGKPISEHGKYVEVWKKQADGSWKCTVDTWNSDSAAAPSK